MRALAKRLIAPNVRHALRVQANHLRQRGVGDLIRWNHLLIDAAVRERLARRRYQMLDEPAVLSARRSDTVFVFGSGYSLNEITPAEWDAIAAHDTFGFTAFIHQRWVRTDFHLIRGGLEGSLRWREYADDFCRTLNENPYFANTILFLQGEYQAQFSNQILGYGLLREGSRIYRYTTARGDGPPTRSLGEGLRHMGGTLSDAVNAAACLGWTHIVLAGVDLYDSRYFWLGPNETYGLDERSGLLAPAEVNVRGWRYDQVHNTARNGVVDIMGRWREHLERERGIRMSVFNPKSLLTSVMPVYERSAPAEPAAKGSPR